MPRAQLADTWRNTGAEVFTRDMDVEPDLIVIDLTSNAILALRADYPDTDILAFGPHVDGEAFRQAKVAGATSQIARGKVVERVLKQLHR